MSVFLANDILANSPREQVIEDIHVLAYLYHWGAEECWKMPCQTRRVFVDRVIKQNKEENRGGKSGKHPAKKPSKYRENIRR